MTLLCNATVILDHKVGTNTNLLEQVLGKSINFIVNKDHSYKK